MEDNKPHLINLDQLQANQPNPEPTTPATEAAPAPASDISISGLTTPEPAPTATPEPTPVQTTAPAAESTIPSPIFSAPAEVSVPKMAPESTPIIQNTAPPVMEMPPNNAQLDAELEQKLSASINQNFSQETDNSKENLKKYLMIGGGATLLLLILWFAYASFFSNSQPEEIEGQDLTQELPLTNSLKTQSSSTEEPQNTSPELEELDTLVNEFEGETPTEEIFSEAVVEEAPAEESFTEETSDFESIPENETTPTKVLR